MAATGGKLMACGYLRKKSPKGLIGLTLWQRRFFCLYENVLTYSRDKDDVGKNQVSGAIPVHEMMAVERVRKDPCRFEIIIAGRVFSLLADSTAEVWNWVAALKAQIVLLKNRSALQRTRSNSDPDLEKPQKYWKDAQGVFDDLNSPNRPSVSASVVSNAFTKIDLSQLASLSSGTLASGKSGLKRITIVPPSNEELEAALASSLQEVQDTTTATTETMPERRFTVEQMKVERILGQGSFGDLCFVIDDVSGEAYMMQKVKPTLPTASMAIDAMRRISSFNNPYIMQCLDYAIVPDVSWAVYELVQGGHLLNHLRSHRRLPEDIARFFVAEIAFAVNYLHKKGTIFRNMDPEHVALDTSGHVVITDFRIAFDASAQNQERRNAEYQTPESIAEQQERAESDWWRFGVLIYELLVGFPPFRDKDPAELHHKIRSCILRFPPFVSAAAADIITRLLDVDLDKRLGSGRNGFHNVQGHGFFAETNWNAVENRNQDVPAAVLALIESSKNTDSAKLL